MQRDRKWIGRAVRRLRRAGWAVMTVRVMPEAGHVAVTMSRGTKSWLCVTTARGIRRSWPPALETQVHWGATYPDCWFQSCITDEFLAGPAPRRRALLPLMARGTLDETYRCDGYSWTTFSCPCCGTRFLLERKPFGVWRLRAAKLYVTNGERLFLTAAPLAASVLH